MFRGVLDRQAGSGAATSPSAFQQHAGRSLDLIHRLRLDRKLDGHEGCVNTVAFTPSGERLVSGSDDLYINIWDWQTGAQYASTTHNQCTVVALHGLAELHLEASCVPFLHSPLVDQKQLKDIWTGCRQSRPEISLWPSQQCFSSQDFA